MRTFPCLQEVHKHCILRLESKMWIYGGQDVVSKDFVVRMIHCYARSSWKIKQNFTAAKVTKNTQNQSLQICENRSIKAQPWTKKILITIKEYLYSKMQQA